ncbi:ABC transporter permease [Comamonas endophytica]|uniref:ABC transporter permease n=1 Tax=Comamonas endophytica TaxID=2949090 RepID=A0ABY6GCL7_9BURK|nr:MULTISPECIES: FtsX-like permease family protein [unclassified Acidovorax]MCD2512822.1 ABC transporter permease [Acidovorax sp. D4N7]UYG52829.1 ABC transporter permease [Acidovorax sp. 5MLIR]
MSRAFLLGLAWRSAWNRRFTLALTVFSIALSTFMLLGVERVRTDLRSSFSSAVSGTDLIVGARTGSVQLLLYSVFHVGAATNNIRWSSVEALEQLRGVAWVVPLSLGDSHRGFPVLGTTPAYFAHFRYGEQQPLQLREGQRFRDLYEVVIGAELADRLGYRIGQRIALAHGTGEISLGAGHDDKPFTISGILARTGTPVDRTAHISLEAMEALHVDWMAGAPLPGKSISAEEARALQLQPRSVTAALVGLHNRAAVFSVQRQVNNFGAEPLMSVLPGVALDELWDVVGAGEQALLLMSGLVALVSMAGLMSVILAGLNERRRELAVLRTVGASPWQVLALLALEGILLTLAGMALGLLALVICVLAFNPWLQAHFGLTLDLRQVTSMQWLLLAGLLLAGWLASLLPGWRAYRLSLADGLSPRI